jgi:hypothetical protein
MACAQAGAVVAVEVLDEGWRWRYTADGASWRILIEPALQLKKSGPVFEIDPERRLYRRDDSLAPAIEVSREAK